MSGLVERVRGTGDDRGSSAIEALAAILMIGTILLVVMQVVWFMIGSGIATQAARDGARAQSLGRSVPAAVARSVPDDTEYRISYPAGDTVRVTVRMGGTLFPMDLQRQVAMPRTDS
ncbi:hypothetical protein [Cellulomonas sp. S1-8]|uniref:hypothetical protein n=1 Tax=Cellulomonas sp. S1-8 TaxID=2904790 RepID=UPI00224382CF|nr:hypothetical protein [Cellulomonas sp. S1-8]UZN02161.1 hypothetical protein OKX07_13830 [Cellulomonas sp. S1-8]